MDNKINNKKRPIAREYPLDHSFFRPDSMWMYALNILISRYDRSHNNMDDVISKQPCRNEYAFINDNIFH